MLTSAEKMRRLRQKRREAGLKQIDLWVLPENEKAVRQYAKRLNDKIGTDNETK